MTDKCVDKNQKSLKWQFPAQSAIKAIIVKFNIIGL
jgi:hypothetical protein